MFTNQVEWITGTEHDIISHAQKIKDKFQKAEPSQFMHVFAIDDQQLAHITEMVCMALDSRTLTANIKDAKNERNLIAMATICHDMVTELEVPETDFIIFGKRKGLKAVDGILELMDMMGIVKGDKIKGQLLNMEDRPYDLTQDLKPSKLDWVVKWEGYLSTLVRLPLNEKTKKKIGEIRSVLKGSVDLKDIRPR